MASLFMSKVVNPRVGVELISTFLPVFPSEASPECRKQKLSENFEKYTVAGELGKSPKI